MVETSLNNCVVNRVKSLNFYFYLPKIKIYLSWAIRPGSLYISRKLPTYPSPKPTFCPKWEVSVKVGLGEGKVSSFSGTYNDQSVSCPDSVFIWSFLFVERVCGILSSPTSFPWLKILARSTLEMQENSSHTFLWAGARQEATPLSCIG